MQGAYGLYSHIRANRRRSVAVLAGLWMIDSSQVRRPPLQARGKGQVREGVRYAWSVHELRVPLVMMAVIGTLAFNFQTVLPLFATRDLHGGGGLFSALMSVVSVGSLVGALLSARRTDVSVRTVSLSAVGFGVSMVLLALSPNEPAAFATGVLMGFTSISFMTSSTAIVQLRAKESMRGRVLALQAIVFLGSTPIGGPLTGWLAETYDPRWTLVLAGISGLSAAWAARTIFTRMSERASSAARPLGASV